MKRVLALLCVLILLSQLLGCWEPAIKNITISEYPDRLIYVVGYDTKLDLSGGELTFHMSFGTKYVDPIEWWEERIRYNIDFDVPGVYVVEVMHYKGSDKWIASDKYTIQVVEKDYIDNLINQGTE